MSRFLAFSGRATMNIYQNPFTGRRLVIVPTSGTIKPLPSSRYVVPSVSTRPNELGKASIEEDYPPTHDRENHGRGETKSELTTYSAFSASSRAARSTLIQDCILMKLSPQNLSQKGQ